MKHILLVIFLGLSFQMVAQIGNVNLKDNWFDKEGNWILSIGNDFVVYKNQRWDYKIEKQTSNKIIFGIKNGLQSQKMIVSAIDSADISVTIDPEMKDKLLSKKRVVRVPVQNNTVRTSPEMITINGFVKNYSKNSEFNNIEIQFADWLSGKYRQLYSKIDDSGYFSISFLQYNPQEFTLCYNKSYIGAYMVPGDTLTVFINANTFPKNVLLMGKHADIAYNVDAYERYSIKRLNKNSWIESEKMHKSDPKSYRIWRDSLRTENYTYINEYINRNQTSEFFKKWLNNDIRYKYLTDLADNYSTYFSFRNQQKEPFDKDYLSLLDSIDFTDSTAIANSELYSVINRFNNLFYEYARTQPDAKQVTVNFMIKRDNRGDDNKNKNSVPQNQSAPNKESKTISSSEINKPQNIVSKPRPEPKLASRSTVSADEYIKAVQSVKNELIRDALVANTYRRYKEYYNSDTLAQKLLSNMKSDRVKSRFYEEYSLEMNVKMNANGVGDSEDDGQTLLKQIISKHKNKVLYIDFWHPYCGPCRQEFSYTGLKDYYKEKKQDVDFIYLCTRGTEKDWQEVIDKYHVQGDHYLLNNRQYVGLTKLINLTGVPRYIIIDRKGNIVNFDAPRPALYNNMLLKTLIDKYVEK